MHACRLPSPSTLQAPCGWGLCGCRAVQHPQERAPTIRLYHTLHQACIHLSHRGHQTTSTRHTAVLMISQSPPAFGCATVRPSAAWMTTTPPDTCVEPLWGKHRGSCRGVESVCIPTNNTRRSTPLHTPVHVCLPLCSVGPLSSVTVQQGQHTTLPSSVPPLASTRRHTVYGMRWPHGHACWGTHPHTVHPQPTHKHMPIPLIHTLDTHIHTPTQTRTPCVPVTAFPCWLSLHSTPCIAQGNAV